MSCYASRFIHFHLSINMLSIKWFEWFGWKFSGAFCLFVWLISVVFFFILFYFYYYSSNASMWKHCVNTFTISNNYTYLLIYQITMVVGLEVKQTDSGMVWQSAVIGALIWSVVVTFETLKQRWKNIWKL